MGTKSPDRQIVWSGHASSEGGPVLVADLGDYLAWTGADEDWGDEAEYRIHYYGPAVEKLPAELLPNGPEEWHQETRVRGATPTKEHVLALESALMKLHPDVTRREQEAMGAAEITKKARAALVAQGAVVGGASPPRPGADAVNDWLTSWRDHIEQGIDYSVGGDRVFHIDVKPDTDYARACDALEDDTVIVRFAGERCALVWDLEGAGTADVARSRDGRSLLLVRTWIDEDEHEHTAKSRANDGEGEAAGDRIELRTGQVAIVWAPVHPKDLVEDDSDPAGVLRAAVHLNPPVPLHISDMLGIGTLLRVVPGTYRAYTGTAEDEGWSCRWLRLRREELPAAPTGF